MPEFVQIIRVKTDRGDELIAMGDEYDKATAGKSTHTSAVSGRDLDTGEYITIVTFPSREAALANDALPETQAFAEKMGALVDGPPSFSNIEVINTM